MASTNELTMCCTSSITDTTSGHQPYITKMFNQMFKLIEQSASNFHHVFLKSFGNYWELFCHNS